MPNTVFTIPVDPGYMFDYLAILDVKMRKATSHATTNAFIDTLNHINNQITDERALSVLRSPEYKALRDANLYVFDLIDAGKITELPASKVDQANYARFLAKRALQAAFFADEAVIEQKIGYGDAVVATPVILS